MQKSIKAFLYKIYLLIPYATGRVKKYFYGAEKDLFHKFIDLIAWLFRDSQFNNNYYAFGLNLKNAKQRDFIGRWEFLELKEKAERLLRRSGGFSGLSYDVLTKDKFVANAFFMANNIPCVPVLGLIHNDHIFFVDGGKKDFAALFSFSNPFVLKNVVLEAGDGFILCIPKDGKIYSDGTLFDLSGLKQKLGNGKWIIQNRIFSHAAIKRINSSALNTTRIVTMLDGQAPVYLTGFQAFATGATEIDSWERGSVYVGFDYNQNLLTGWGFYHPHIKGRARIEKHPDSGIRFHGYQIPFLKKSVGLCLQAHQLLYNNFVIGWDVVITDDGPLILEANEKPGMNAVQCVDGGLRHKIRKFYINTVNYLKKRQ
jgi:Sugar-transfer associated ATP-grasp